MVSQCAVQAINDDANWSIQADGGVLAECPAIPIVDTATACPAASSAPNMWDTAHKLYTVYTLEEDRTAGAFAHTCVDAEFPHFPYAHYTTFSASFLLSLSFLHAAYLHVAGSVCTSCGSIACVAGGAIGHLVHCVSQCPEACLQVTSSILGSAAGAGTSRSLSTQHPCARRTCAWRGTPPTHPSSTRALAT